MTRVLYTPEAHAVFNEIDSHGTLMGLPRLELEKNAAYKQRILDVMVHRANSSYIGLINGITRELGLTIDRVLNISMQLDDDDNPVLASPAIVFQDTKCILYSDYGAGTILNTLDRFELDGGCFTLNQLVTEINKSGYFTASLLSGVNGNARSMTIFNQSSVVDVPTEDVATGGPYIQLENQGLLEGTIALSSSNLNRRVLSEEAIVQDGDYYIGLTEGVLLAASAPAPGSIIRYKYAQYDLVFNSSPVIIHNLQSSDFQSKMFHTTEDGDLGLPTSLGADTVNEILSITGTLWGS